MIEREVYDAFDLRIWRIELDDTSTLFHFVCFGCTLCVYSPGFKWNTDHGFFLRLGDDPTPPEPIVKICADHAQMIFKTWKET